MIRPNEVYQGDAFKLIDEIDDKTIDLILCDGPYGVTEKKVGQHK